MGVHAGQLALKSDLRLVQEYRRSLLPCLEQARRPTLDHYVYRSSGLVVWVLISENWYYGLRPCSGSSCSGLSIIPNWNVQQPVKQTSLGLFSREDTPRPQRFRPVPSAWY